MFRPIWVLTLVMAVGYAVIAGSELLSSATASAKSRAADSLVVFCTERGDVTILLRADWNAAACDCFVRNCQRGAVAGTLLTGHNSGFVTAGAVAAGSVAPPPGARLAQAQSGSEAPWSRGRIAFRPNMSESGSNETPELIIALRSDFEAPLTMSVFGEVISGLDILDELAASSAATGISSVEIAN
jgi:hypothetical protein